MRELRYNNPRAEIFRKAAFILFFAGLAVFLGGLVPSMYYGSGVGVLVTLALSSIIFGLAFVIGGIGWAQIEEPMTTVSPPAPGLEEDLSREWGEPYQPPHATDENRPPP